MKPTNTVLLATALLVAAFAGATATPASLDNDAGTGGDAGDTPDDAYQGIRTGVTYTGNLTPPGDADWYRLDFNGTDVQPNPLCVDLFVAGQAHANVTLASANGHINRSHLTNHTKNPTTPLSLALVVSDLKDYIIGFEPAQVQEADLKDETSAGLYTFNAALLTKSMVEAVNGDGGTSGDAGDDRATAKALESACFGGEFSNGDTVDAYTFTGQAGYTLEYSLGKGDSSTDTVTMTLVAPDNTTVDTISSGSTNSTLIDETQTGEWLVIVESTDGGSGTYLGSLTMNDGAWPQCRPSCRGPIDMPDLIAVN